MVGLDDSLGNGEAEPESTELAGHTRVALGESIKNAGESVRGDADAGVVNDENDAALGEAGGDRDVAVFGGKFGSVLEKIPNDLLEPSGVAGQMVGGGGEGDRDLLTFALDLSGRDLEGAVDHLMQIDGAKRDLEFAMLDAGHIKEVIDEESLDLDVAADEVELVVGGGREIGLAGKNLESKKDGGERGAEFVRKQSEKVVLGLAGGFDGGAGGLVLPQSLDELLTASLEGLLDMARLRLVAEDFHEADGLAGGVAHGHHDTAAPEAFPILTDMPTFVGGATFREGGDRLFFRQAGSAVFGSKNDIGRLAEDFLLGIAEDALGADVPSGDATFEVGGEDDVLAGVFDHKTEAGLALAQGFVRALSLLAGLDSVLQEIKSRAAGVVIQKVRGLQFVDAAAELGTGLLKDLLIPLLTQGLIAGGEVGALILVSQSRQPGRVGKRVSCGRGGRISSQGKGEGKGRAGRRIDFDPETAAMRFDNFPGAGQAQTIAQIPGQEKAVGHGGSETGAVVGNGNDKSGVAIVAAKADGEMDGLAFRTELDGVFQQVHEGAHEERAVSE